MRDPETGNSKGFAFINFANFEASDAAMEAMNGQYLCNRPISVSYAFKKDSKGERHGSAAERLLAAQNPLSHADRPHQLFADAPAAPIPPMMPPMLNSMIPPPMIAPTLAPPPPPQSMIPPPPPVPPPPMLGPMHGMKMPNFPTGHPNSFGAIPPPPLPPTMMPGHRMPPLPPLPAMHMHGMPPLPPQPPMAPPIPQEQR